jgi:hypothetical protein
VIPLAAGEPKHALFQNGVTSVPKRQCENKQLITIADPRNAVLTPAIGLAACLIMCEELPCVAIAAIVLADASPTPIADVRSPSAPAVEVGIG